MNNPRRQHYIPKSYLKNFARTSRKGQKFVEVIDVQTQENNLVNIKNVCVDKNLYTFPEGVNEDQYALEKMYAGEVDSLYPEVYKLLINPEIKRIDQKTKFAILRTVLSFLFRTPKHLNQLNASIGKEIVTAFNKSDPNKEFFEVDHLGKQLKFTKDDVNQIKAAINEENRKTFLPFHLKLWSDIVNHKINCLISVYTVTGDVKLITCDNPVIVNNYKKEVFGVFDGANSMQIPLDQNHFLNIYPNHIDDENCLIHRSTVERVVGMILNSNVEQNAEKWIIGYPESCKRHMVEKHSLEKPTKSDIEEIEMMEQKYLYQKELLRIIEKYGFYSLPTSKKVKELIGKDIFKNDPDLVYVASMLKLKNL